MVRFKVNPHPSEATVLNGRDSVRTLYSVGIEPDSGADGEQELPVFWGVVLDRSGSMNGQNIRDAKRALKGLLGRIPPRADTVVHLVLFSNDAEELYPPMTGVELSQRRRRLEQDIDRIQAGGGTSLGTGLRLVGDAARAYSGYERRVLLVTDGKQESELPVEDAYDAARSLARNKIRIDAWGVGFDWKAEELRTIAHATGGEADVIPTAQELEAAVGELFEEVKGTRASDVRLVLESPKGTTIRGVRQVFPSVQDRAPSQESERRWVIPVGAIGSEEYKFIVEVETPPRQTDLPFRILVPTVLYRLGEEEGAAELDKSSWFFVKWVKTPQEVAMDAQLSRFTGEEEVASLSQEGFALLAVGEVQAATGKLKAALDKAQEVGSPQAEVLAGVVNPATGRLVSSDPNAAVNKTGRLHTGKTGRIAASTGKLPGGGSAST